MNASILTAQLFNGLSSASVLLLMAAGLAVVFGLMGVINMAHGELMTAGAYVAYLSERLLSHVTAHGTSLAFLVALPASFAVSALLGLVLDIALIRFLYRRPLETLLATWGVSLVMQQGFRSIFGSNNVSVATPSWLQSGLKITSDLQLPYVRLFILGLTAVTVGALYITLYRTRTGLLIRACMQNRSMTACCAIPVRRIDAVTFALGSGLAGLAGCVLSLIGSIGPTTGQNYLVDAFMVVVMGGVGKLAGTVVGAILMGELQSTFEYVTSPTTGKILIFVLIIALLQVRPAGLFPARTRVLD